MRWFRGDVNGNVLVNAVFYLELEDTAANSVKLLFQEKIRSVLIADEVIFRSLYDTGPL